MVFGQHVSPWFAFNVFKCLWWYLLYIPFIFLVFVFSSQLNSHPTTVPPVNFMLWYYMCVQLCFTFGFASLWQFRPKLNRFNTYSLGQNWTGSIHSIQLLIKHQSGVVKRSENNEWIRPNLFFFSFWFWNAVRIMTIPYYMNFSFIVQLHNDSRTGLGNIFFDNLFFSESFS